MGLTIIPINKPKRIHNLFRGSNKSGLTKVTARISKPSETKVYAGRALLLR